MFVTGRYNGNTTIRGNDGAYTPFREADRDSNIPAVLAKAGYESMLIGKWGLGDFGTTGYPTNQSWSGFYGYDSQVACHDWYPATLFSQDAPVKFPENSNVCNIFNQDMFRNQTLAYLAAKAKSDTPFFLFLSYVSPHAGNCEHEASSHVEPGPYAVPYAEPVYANDSWAQTFVDYASGITRQDRDTGAVLEQLEALGLADNTVVMFASDNGPEETIYQFFNSTGKQPNLSSNEEARQVASRPPD
jgi:arylsulfatase A-like enzyme